jgi:hypothetical protein
MSTKETSSANAELRAWYLRRLRPRLALAARERGISAAQAAALDQTMRELLGVHVPDAARSGAAESSKSTSWPTPTAFSSSTSISSTMRQRRRPSMQRRSASAAHASLKTPRRRKVE